MNVVIDTNCLLVAVPANSEHKWLYDAFVNERFTWYVSTEILNEYAEKLGEFFGLGYLHECGLSRLERQTSSRCRASLFPVGNCRYVAAIQKLNRTINRCDPPHQPTHPQSQRADAGV
ncbi:PIN domain-containing protein [Spirosoma montaniterrae]|uniref:PIN domain-containing protein n=1 Tax=Spirosoma montaniterrae TaxID=1178516 RepID=UPI0012F755EB|nr:hypothetical protein [Spirosoma montaniterrae]